MLPKNAIQSKTDFGKSEFGGACPPIGDKANSYITTIYALDIKELQLDKNANPALVRCGMVILSKTQGVKK